MIPAELRVLDKPPLPHQLQELLLGREVVFAAILFAGPRRPRCVRHAEPELVGELGEQSLQDRGLAGPAGTGDHDRSVRG